MIDIKSIQNTLTDIPGLLVGHAHDLEGITGCTVVLCSKDAVAGVDQRGGAPGTRETDLLRPLHRVERVNAVLLTGGSAYGLDAAAGVMRYLEEQGIGFDVSVAVVPIVPAAVIFDLAIGSAAARPDGEMGYQACLNTSASPVEQGCVGAGTGATLGKILGMAQAVKSGLGSATVDIGAGLLVSALVVVNPLGDVINPQTGQILAGARGMGEASGTPGNFADTLQMMKNMAGMQLASSASRSNTVIGVVATNARLSKEQANKVAQMAHNGIARTVRPAHTMYDGDTIFALSAGDLPGDENLIGACAAEAVADAVINAVKSAVSMGGVPALKDL